MKFVKQTLEPEDYYDYADYKQEMSRDQLYVQPVRQEMIMQAAGVLSSDEDEFVKTSRIAQ